MGVWSHSAKVSMTDYPVVCDHLNRQCVYSSSTNTCISSFKCVMSDMTSLSGFSGLATHEFQSFVRRRAQNSDFFIAGSGQFNSTYAFRYLGTSLWEGRFVLFHEYFESLLIISNHILKCNFVKPASNFTEWTKTIRINYKICRVFQKTLIS